jgi:hypothetical protein
MPSGWPSSKAPKVTPASEGHPFARLMILEACVSLEWAPGDHPRDLAPGTNGASGADESGEQGLQFQLGFLQFGPGPGSGHDADAGVHRGVVAVYVS